MLIGHYYVSTLVCNIPKLQDGSVKSDIFPKDRQNFSSCVKLCIDYVIACLKYIDVSEGIVFCLHLLRSIMITYINISANPIDQIYYARSSIFICRLWYFWVDNMSKNAFRSKII